MLSEKAADGGLYKAFPRNLPWWLFPQHHTTQHNKNVGDEITQLVFGHLFLPFLNEAVLWYSKAPVSFPTVKQGKPSFWTPGVRRKAGCKQKKSSCHNIRAALCDQVKIPFFFFANLNFIFLPALPKGFPCLLYQKVPCPP